MQTQPKSDTRFLKNGKVTSPLVRNLEAILRSYGNAAILLSKSAKRPPMDFIVREVHVVGSVLKGVDDSDLDLLLIANKIGQEEYRFFKTFLAQIFYANRDKKDAIDAYVRPHDEYPERASYDITSQVRRMLDRYNTKIAAQTYFE